VEILIISGLSGSGKSRAATFLEDIGYYIVDNLPAEMMLKFANFCTASGGRYDRVALVYDVRAGEPFQRLVDVVDKLRRKGGVRCRMLFLEADTRAIISRYKETRRSHPLCVEGLSIEEAVRRERELLAPVRERADFVLDTSAFSTAKLRSELLSLFGGGDTQQALNVSVMSFGFKNGLPLEADLVFDVRFLPNPYYVPELKHLTGLDEPVREYVFASEAAGRFLERLEPLLAFLLPQYLQEGRTELVIAVGCTGGRHRSTAMAHHLANYIGELGYPVSESHRDISR
jgi:UPF0042 nucleotide-binding protein clos_0574